MANKQVRGMRNGKPLYYDKDAIWYMSHGTMQENGYNKDTGVSKVFKKSSGEKEIQFYAKNKEYKEVERKKDNNGNTWLVTFMDITNDRKATVSFQLGDLYAKGGTINVGDNVHIPHLNKSGVVSIKHKHKPTVYIVKFVNGSTAPFIKEDLEKIKEFEDGGNINTWNYSIGGL